MRKTTEETSTAAFTQVPHTWSRRQDVPLAKKVIVAYIYTRAKIESVEWELVAADIANQWAIGKATVSRVMRELKEKGVIHYTETRRINKGEWPSKIFKINRNALHELMNSPANAVPSRNRSSSTVEPHQFRGETAPVPLANLEEELKEENNKKNPEKEAKSEILPFFDSASSTMPPTKSFDEKFDEIFGAVSPKKQFQELSGSAAFPSNNPTDTPKITDTKAERNDSSTRPADAANNNLPIPSARPEKVGEVPKAEQKPLEHTQPSLTVPRIEKTPNDSKRAEIAGRLYTKWLTSGKKKGWPAPDFEVQIAEHS